MKMKLSLKNSLKSKQEPKKKKISTNANKV